MIANYKGKDFFSMSMGNDLIELRSNSSEDNTFVYNDGIYTKSVKKAECSNIRKCWTEQLQGKQSLLVKREQD